MERIDRLIEWSAPYRKAIVAWLIPLVVALQSVITDGITSAEWLTIVLAALGAQGVYQVSNRPRRS